MSEILKEAIENVDAEYDDSEVQEGTWSNWSDHYYAR